ncbi:MAG: hypothetical protein KF743_13740 [Fimbriimonadaceae bacterium]|nr:hypothetical protein [Fimbriimonadaceae bacterium]
MDVTDLRRTNLMEVVEKLARQHNLDINDASAREAIAGLFANEIQEVVANPIRVFGWRTEAMFAFVVASLGKIHVLKGEDAGLLVSGAAVTPPDYRALLNTGAQMFVEVKNWSPRGVVPKPFRIRSVDVERLQAYSSAFGIELRFAIYWRKPNLWTLTRADDFEQDGDKLQIAFEDAVKRSTMCDLGDFMVGAEPPLSLRLEPEDPLQLPEHGNVDFQVGRASLTSAGVEIESEFERQLAWYFMLFGNWTAFRQEPIVQGNEFLGVENQVEPEEWEPRQGFAFLGFLSSMISNVFRSRTTKDDRVSLLSPQGDPGTFGICIPDDYKGDVLKLWRFHQRPNRE